MAATNRIDPAESIVYLTTVGNTSFAEWREAMQVVLADPAYHPGFNFLSDRRRQTDIPGAEFVREGTDFLKLHSAERWAASSGRKSPPSPAIYGMRRMFSIFSKMKGIKAQAFTDYEEAVEWVRERPGRDLICTRRRAPFERGWF